MKKIIALIGNKRAWKDYTFSILQTINPFIEFKRFAFADILKREYIANYNFNLAFEFESDESDELTLEKLEQDKESHRKWLQSWGDYRRKDNSNYFTDNTLSEIKKSFETEDIEIAVVTDCRFQNEQSELIQFAFKNNIELIFVKINNPNCSVDSHISESQVAWLFANYTLVNEYNKDYKYLVHKNLSKEIEWLALDSLKYTNFNAL